MKNTTRCAFKKGGIQQVVYQLIDEMHILRL